jgi:hypothetical protein
LPLRSHASGLGRPEAVRSGPAAVNQGLVRGALVLVVLVGGGLRSALLGQPPVGVDAFEDVRTVAVHAAQLGGAVSKRARVAVADSLHLMQDFGGRLFGFIAQLVDDPLSRVVGQRRTERRADVPINGAARRCASASDAAISSRLTPISVSWRRCKSICLVARCTSAESLIGWASCSRFQAASNRSLAAAKSS